MPDPIPANVTVKRAAIRIGCGRTTIYGFINAKLLRKIKLGYKTLIPVADVERLLETLQDGTLKLDKRDQREGEAAKNAAHRERMRARRAEAKAAKASATGRHP